MADPRSWLVIRRGWKVLASDGSRVGSVARTLGDENRDIFAGLAVSRGLLAKTVYVPSEQVAEIVEGAVTLSIGADEIDRLDTARPPWAERGFRNRVLR